MTLLKRATNLLFVAATAGAVVGLAAAPAMAATTLKVQVTNGGTYTATAGKTVLSDNGVSVTCTSTTTTKASKGSGTVATATHTGTSPVKVGTVAKLSFNNCTGPLGAVHTTITGLPYSIKVDSTTNGTGKTDGMITGAKVKVTMTGCSFMVTGSAPGFYTNSTHKLAVTSKLPITPLNKAQLTVSGVSGCAGLVNNGDHPSYTSTYTISRAFKIKSTKS
ncbi:MAG: hypothetical protein LBV34_20630 [Nocardiopsaceae bacterium]|jgi:uncharacterized protein YpuA (DUF1002 family)|nr:hypothetical protein [Nocardiopsaceae bacterium]